MDNDAKHFTVSIPNFTADRLSELPLTPFERDEALRHVALGRRFAHGVLMGAIAALALAALMALVLL
jgi:hypothetical protein